MCSALSCSGVSLHVKLSAPFKKHFFEGKVQQFGKYSYLFSGRELDETVDIYRETQSHVIILNLCVQTGKPQTSYMQHLVWEERGLTLKNTSTEWCIESTLWWYFYESDITLGDSRRKLCTIQTNCIKVMIIIKHCWLKQWCKSKFSWLYEELSAGLLRTACLVNVVTGGPVCMLS